ncbi:MAG: PilT/PilU family type 4a pilus ATPase [Lachnospiraceae bacterium]|nr:PilT/PilU family type 4a pilus ATPase [Lachnospiraceae bacterium]
MALDAKKMMEKAVARNCADVFIVAGNSVTMRVNGSIEKLEMADVTTEDDTDRKPFLMPNDTEELIKQFYAMAGNRSMEKLMKTGDDDFSFAIPGVSRFRMNAYRQRGSLAAVIRVIAFEIPKPEDIHIPKQILDFGDLQKGLVVVTGPAGSGKSTTLACIIDHINSTKTANIITLEDPIEFLHKHKMGVISQREIENDTMSYVNGLRATLRQSPDVILLGEMRDYETISVAMNAAETGHLLFSTLHTVGAASTINRIIDVFPSDQQRQVSVMLSMILQAVVSQQLLPTVDGGMIPAFEIMVNTPAVSNLIRSGKAYQIDSVIASEKELMLSMDACIWGYYKQGIITKEVALQHAINQEMLERRL